MKFIIEVYEKENGEIPFDYFVSQLNTETTGLGGMGMRYSEIKEKYLKDPETLRAYEEMEPEYQLIYAIVESRREKNISQQELANMTGIDRSDISKMENGNANPSLKTIKRIAEGLGKRVEIRFV